MNNTQYVICMTNNPLRQKRCLEAMDKYGDNHWWEPGVPPEKFAWFQLNEPTLLVDSFSRFHEAVEKLLGRPVITFEFVHCEQLIAEAMRRMPCD